MKGSHTQSLKEKVASFVLRSCRCFPNSGSIQLQKRSSVNSAPRACAGMPMMTSVLSPLTHIGSVRSTLPCRTICGCIVAFVVMVAKRKFGMQLDRSRACVTRVKDGFGWRGVQALTLPPPLPPQTV